MGRKLEYRLCLNEGITLFPVALTHTKLFVLHIYIYIYIYFGGGGGGMFDFMFNNIFYKFAVYVSC